MSFTVKHDEVRKFGHNVGNLSADADKATGYTQDHLSIDYGDGRMFFTVAQTANEVRAALEANYKQLSRLVDGCEIEVTKAANLYRDTDDAAAARADAAY